MAETNGEVTRLLTAVRAGDSVARSELAGLVYGELRVIARRLMARERPDHTLQATVLVNEAFMRLVGQQKDWKNRAHFFAVAAQLMRRLLIDYARAHSAEKRPGALQRIDLEHVPIFSREYSGKLLALDEALSRLAEWDSRQSQVVEMRFFGGLTEDEIAEVLQTSVRTVKRDWSMAKAWLLGELGP